MAIDPPTGIVRTRGFFKVSNFPQTNIALASLDRDVNELFEMAGTGSENHAPAVADVAALRAVVEADRKDKDVRLVESATGGPTTGALYRFDSTGTGVDDGNLIITPTVGSGRWFKISNFGSTAHPVDDGTALVKGSVDDTKLVRIEADALTTATTRVINMPDKDVTLDDASDPRTPTAHTSTHIDGGSDELPVAALAEAAAPSNDVSRALRPDGVGGVVFVDVAHVDRERPWMLVVGGEERGLRRLTLKTCDEVCCVPERGELSSLNVSVATAILMDHLTSS